MPTAEEKKASFFGKGDPIPEIIEPEKTEEEAQADGVSTEQSDTDTGTGIKPDTETGTGGEDGSLQEVMTELGLAAQYKSPEQALQAVAHQRQRIEDQRQENLELRRILQENARQGPVSPAITEGQAAEELPERPIETMKKAGFVERSDIDPALKKIDDLEYRMQVQANVNAVSRYDELRDIAPVINQTGQYPVGTNNPVWEAMMAEFHKRPSIGNLTADDCVDVLYNMVKNKAEPSPPVRKTNKGAVSTTSTGRKPSRGDKAPDFSKADWRDIRKWYADQGMID